MLDVFAFFSDGNEAGISKWNGGEGTKLMNECKKIRQDAPLDSSQPYIERVLKGGRIDWGSCLGCLLPLSNGNLETPWQKGRWGGAGRVSVYPDFDETIFATLGGATHLLRFNSTGHFLSTRCNDGEQLWGVQPGYPRRR